MATKREKLHKNRLAALGCLICKRPPEIHHIRKGTGLGLRESDFRALPLCFDHHSAQTRLPFGYAVHKGTKSFEARFGDQLDLLDRVYAKLNALYPDDYPSPKYDEELYA